MSKKSKNIFLVLAFVSSVILLFTFYSLFAKADKVLVDLAKKVRPAVVLIKTFDENSKPMGQGSGFFISTQGHLITNLHVVEGAYSANITTMAGKTYPIKGIMAKDVEADVAKLLIDVPGNKIPVLELANVLPSVGEDIAVVGNPLGLESTVSKGIVSAIREIPTFGNIVQISAPISPGSSGSPVLNMEGQVIGVATFILTEGQSLNFAVPSARVLALKPDDKLTSLQRYFGEWIAKETETTESNVVEKACELIYQGKFDAADELIEHQLSLGSGPIGAEQPGQDAQPQSALSELAEIVQGYKDISRERQSAREAAYKEQLSELEKLRAETDANDVNDVIAGDVNDIVAALSVIAKASEFADQTKKEQLLSDGFVKEIVQKAIDKSAEFEVKGKWLEAYANCYPWLQAIDPNNEGYSDYGRQLLDKAAIAAAFQDSPCETREERFKGVKEGIFVRAINALSLDYVTVIDYGQMATKAIERCKLLAEVLDPRFSILGEDQESRIENQGSAWSAALVALLDEVKSASSEPTRFSKQKFVDVFEKVLKINEATIDLPSPVLIVQFAEAALSTLDPYTVIVWPRQMQNFEKMMTSKFTGIGIEISKQKGLLTVASLLLDTPAFNSGLLDAGDVIEMVDGVETKDMTLTCAVHKITGPAGTKVTLTVRRPSGDKDIEDKVFDIILTRAKIIVPTIRGWQRTEAGKWLYMIDDGSKIGYVRIYHSFSERTAANLEKVLLELEAEGLRGLILDLRFNSGGLLDSAVAISDKFLKEGLIVSTQPGFRRKPVYKPAHRRGTHPNYPLVILINSSSASASEIVAGALADEAHGRAVLVGTRTHGKGSVQGVTAYPGGGAQLKYTMAYYHLPSGRRVESQDAMKKQDRKDWGVGPDIEVELRTVELRKMIDVQRDNDVLVKADHVSAGAELKKHTIEETLAADPQLAVGLLVVKSKLIETQNAKSKI